MPANPTYSITHSSVTSRHFPAQAFSTSTRPTSTDVTTLIAAAAAEVNGVLDQVGLDPATINTDAGSNYPITYAWCQRMVALGAAYQAARAMKGDDSELAKALEHEFHGDPSKWVDGRPGGQLGAVLANAGLLADAPFATTENEGGPVSHITRLGLDTPSSDEYTDNVKPVFRWDDEH